MSTLADHYFSSCLDYLDSLGLESQSVLMAINFNEYATLPTIKSINQEVKQYNKQLSPRISLSSYNALLDYAKCTLNEPLFGFKLGQNIRTADFGMLGYLVESSDTLASAISALLNYDSLVADIGTAQFEVKEDIAIIRWVPNPSCNPQVILRNMTAWVSMIRQLLNSQLTPHTVYLTPSWLDAETKILTEWFNCPVKTNAYHNQIIFPSSYLALSFKTDNEQVNNALKHISNQHLSNFKSLQLLSEKINHILMARNDLIDCNLIQIASVLNFSPRTIQRHLKKEQTTFNQLLEHEKKRRLQNYINQMPLSAIALNLGFNDQSSFNRAFKRWYGYSPLYYLKHNLKASRSSLLGKVK